MNKCPSKQHNFMLPEFVEKLKNIDEIYESKFGEVPRIEHELISEFLNSGDEAVEPISQVLGDASSSSSTLELALRMIDASKNKKFVPCLIQFLRKNDDDDLCEMASDILYNYGEPAAPSVITALEEDFGKGVYNDWMVNALNGSRAREFVEKTLNDFLGDPKKYEDWFNVGHFAWRLADDERKNNSLGLVERLLGLNLHREDKLELKRLQKFLTDKESYRRDALEEDLKRTELLSGLTLVGVLNSPIADIVPDGPRPVIDDTNREEYLPLLYQIERFIFDYYNANPSIKDSDVIKLLKNVRDGIWKGQEGKDEFEKSFIMGLKLAVFSLDDLRYTKGEVSACISHVLNSVKRHREEGYGRSYLEFINDVFKKRLTGDSELKPKF